MDYKDHKLGDLVMFANSIICLCFRKRKTDGNKSLFPERFLTNQRHESWLDNLYFEAFGVLCNRFYIRNMGLSFFFFFD